MGGSLGLPFHLSVFPPLPPEVSGFSVLERWEGMAGQRIRSSLTPGVPAMAGTAGEERRAAHVASWTQQVSPFLWATGRLLGGPGCPFPRGASRCSSLSACVLLDPLLQPLAELGIGPCVFWGLSCDPPCVSGATVTILATTRSVPQTLGKS